MIKRGMQTVVLRYHNFPTGYQAEEARERESNTVLFGSVVQATLS